MVDLNRASAVKTQIDAFEALGQLMGHHDLKCGRLIGYHNFLRTCTNDENRREQQNQHFFISYAASFLVKSRDRSKTYFKLSVDSGQNWPAKRNIACSKTQRVPWKESAPIFSTLPS